MGGLPKFSLRVGNAVLHAALWVTHCGRFHLREGSATVARIISENKSERVKKNPTTLMLTHDRLVFSDLWFRPGPSGGVGWSAAHDSGSGDAVLPSSWDPHGEPPLLQLHRYLVRRLHLRRAAGPTHPLPSPESHPAGKTPLQRRWVRNTHDIIKNITKLQWERSLDKLFLMIFSDGFTEIWYVSKVLSIFLIFYLLLINKYTSTIYYIAD